MADIYNALKLENQLCFPLYACAKEVIRQYKPYLDELDITYTQYITFMVLWEHKELTVKELGSYLYLDSGTLTPVLKRLEQKGWITRNRNNDDERSVTIKLTDDGEKLKEKAVDIPAKVGKCVTLEPQEAATLYALLHKMLGKFYND